MFKEQDLVMEKITQGRPKFYSQHLMLPKHHYLCTHFSWTQQTFPMKTAQTKSPSWSRSRKEFYSANIYTTFLHLSEWRFYHLLLPLSRSWKVWAQNRHLYKNKLKYSLSLFLRTLPQEKSMQGKHVCKTSATKPNKVWTRCPQKAWQQGQRRAKKPMSTGTKVTEWGSASEKP